MHAPFSHMNVGLIINLINETYFYVREKNNFNST